MIIESPMVGYLDTKVQVTKYPPKKGFILFFLFNFIFIMEYDYHLKMLLNLTESIYLRYNNDGKKFIYTILLRKYNQLLLNLLIDNPKKLEGIFYEEFLYLIEHLSIWIEKWDVYSEKYSPELNQKFIFKNEIIFPKEFIKKLLN